MTDAPTLSSLAKLLRGHGLDAEIRGPGEVSVGGVSQDSRTLSPGDLFLAWRGVDHDAHDFLEGALGRGAVAAVVERWVPEVNLPQLEVSDGRRAGALVADALARSPWKELFVAGVTGTNGKSTTTILLRHLLRTRGPAVACGTLGLVEPTGGFRPGTAELTTPGPVATSRRLREFADRKVWGVAMEASSHGLSQRRLDGVAFNAAVFTNITSDHLDFHGRWENYFAAKARLLDLLRPGGTAVINGEDRAWRRLRLGGRRRLRYAIDAEADLRAEELRPNRLGYDFMLSLSGERREVAFPLLGRFNVENALAAAGAATVAGISLSEIAVALSTAPQIPGRLELVVREPFSVMIDYAHSPDALDRVCEALHHLAEGRLIVVFGAAGDRDREKRPMMARAVARWAGVIFVTSENPRTEDPARIIDEVMAGLGGAPAERIDDRKEAIARAMETAEPGDVVLIAGKGHERYQIVGREKLPFDEREIVRASLPWRSGRGRESGRETALGGMG